MENQRPPGILILSTSLSSKSRSRNLCRYAYQVALKQELNVRFVDLRDFRVLPYGMAGSDGLEEIEREMEAAECLLIGYPLYNYNMSSGLKAVVERLGGTLEGKVVGLIVAAGGRSGYMSTMSVIASLMLDFRTWIVPRYVYASSDDFDEEKEIRNPDLYERLEELLSVTYRTAWQHKLPLPEA